MAALPYAAPGSRRSAFSQILPILRLGGFMRSSGKLPAPHALSRLLPDKGWLPDIIWSCLT